MVTSSQIVPGMIISVGESLFRIETCVKVNVPKGASFMKTKLKDLGTNELSEKNFKIGLDLKDVSLAECALEYLYKEGDEFLFLDVKNLEQVHVPMHIVGEHECYLKEGVQMKAAFYGEVIFSLELPLFLELMVTEIDGDDEEVLASNVTRVATLETGATMEVPPFITVGDIIKVDTRAGEYIQRI